MEKNNSTSTWGGKRVGCGRKKTGRTHNVTLTLGDEAYAVWSEMTNRSRTIEEFLISSKQSQ